MKKILIASLIVSILIVVSGFSGTASAGVEPSPFKSTLGKVGSIDNNLAEIHRNLNLVLAEPPLNDQTPGWKGPANRLDALAKQLTVVKLRLYEILDAQDPGVPLIELFEYLEEAILYRLDSIEHEMLDFLRVHSNDIERMPEAFLDSFYEVFDLIHDMQDRIFEFINPPPWP